MRGKYGALVAILLLVVAFWGDRHEWGAAAFGLILLGVIVAGVVVLWRLSGLSNAITFRRDR